ncbi:MAG TPA: hypothetical protein VE291_07395 [Terracidiphilus sp.]|jgi:hypothetical protein|nr:hypothetical protein [Terracidiphilus sp.]
MPQPSATVPAPKGSSFASLLAGLAARNPDGREHAGREHDGLEDDVATISYEHALRTHARTRPAAALGLPMEQPLPETAKAGASATQPSGERRAKKARQARKKMDSTRAVVAPAPRAALVAGRKSASPPRRTSLTIRLSDDECAQVHARAAAAGLSASAYLRFCLFEVEALRAQVKEALEQFRTAPAIDRAAARKPARAEEGAGWRWWLRERWPAAAGWLGGEKTA